MSRTVIINIFSIFVSRIWLAILALIAIPYMVKYLGAEVYALLSLTLVVTGYFYLLDLGLGRGIVKFVSEYKGADNQDSLAELLQTTLSVYSIMAIAGALILWFSTPILVKKVFHIPADLHKEALMAFYCTSVGLFFKILQVLCASIITGYQKLSLLSFINIIVNSIRIIGTIFLLVLGASLVDIVILNVIMGILHFIMLFYIVNKIIPQERFTFSFSPTLAKCLVGFSSKAFITDFAGIICINLDKLLIGMFLPIKKLAYYSASFELASRIWMIPSVITTAIFPSISEKVSIGDNSGAIRLYVNASRLIFIGAAFFSFILFAFSYVILKFWVDSDFAEQGSVILQLLSIAVFVSSLGWSAVSLANGFGFPGIPAKIHSFAAVINVLLCLYLIPTYGIKGAALAWLIEHVIAVGMLLTKVNRRFANMSWIDYIKKIAIKPLLIVFFSVFVLKYIFLDKSSTVSAVVIFIGISGILYLFLNLSLNFSKEERVFLRNFFRKTIES